MSREPLDLAIVIISWNTLEITRDCLRSVFDNLGDLAAEVFVVDNASSDATVEMIRREFPQVTLIVNDSNRGFAAANNQALRIAKARNYLLLNSDTVVLGDVLRKSVDYMDRHQDIGLFGCKVLNADKTTQSNCFRDPGLSTLLVWASGLSSLPWTCFYSWPRYGRWKYDSERDVDVVTGCYLMTSDAALRRVGLLDERFFFMGEEADWARTYRDAGWRVVFAPVGEIIHLGGISVERIGPERGILLVETTVQYNRKWGGRLGGVAAKALMMFYFATRCLSSYAAFVVTQKERWKVRANRFWKVLAAAIRTSEAQAARRPSGSSQKAGY